MKKAGMLLRVFVLLYGAFLSTVPAAEIKIWTSDVVSDELLPKAVKELKPILLAGARNGSFSGKLVVESNGMIKGIKASAGALAGKDGTIPAQNVQVRYAAWFPQKWGWPTRPDVLLETPPEVNTAGKDPAFLPVWITVKVPKDAKAGIYNGEVTVQQEGASSVRVKLELSVEDWTLPDSQDYRTWMDFIESPDTLAVEYNVPLWSEKHWKLIDRSFRLLSPTGGRTLYVPLICRTNFGNEQSMVRWIKKGENKYEYDYSVMDKYLDSAEKNLGKPKLIIFLVWDICMSAKSLERGLWSKDNATGKSRAELLGKGPRVTVLDPETKTAGVLILPRYEDPASKTLWQPMFAEVKKRLEKRGLEKTMMLGIMPDLWPNKEEVTFWKDVSGGLAWAIHGHAGAAKDVMIGNKGLYKIADIGYAAYVYNLIYNVNPDKGRLYGWHNPALLTCYLRLGELNRAPGSYTRALPAFYITGGERGGGRIGGDFWPAMKNSKGDRAGAVYARYPENNWRNLDISDWFLAPGPEGAVSTVRLECLNEGIQECEARIFLEDALLDSGKKAKLGTELAKRCQDALDEHHRALWKTVWNNDEDLKLIGQVGEARNPVEAIITALIKAGKKIKYGGEATIPIQVEESKKGQEWFALGWLEREKKLFALAGEVDVKVSGRKASVGSDSPEQAAIVISNNTGIAKEKILELAKNKGIKMDDVMIICAAAEITKAEPEELYKKRKKVNTTFEFILDLKLEKAAKASLDALIAKLKTALEEEKKKK